MILVVFPGFLSATLCAKSFALLKVKQGSHVARRHGCKMDAFKQKLGVVICCHYSELEVGRALKSLIKNGILPENIIVVDNASAPTPPDQTRSVVHSVHPGIQYIYVALGLKSLALWRGVNMFPPSITHIIHMDDDTIMQDGMIFDPAHFEDANVAAVAFDIRVRHVKNSMVESCVDLEFMLKNRMRSFRSTFGQTCWFAHGIIGMWRRKVLQEILHEHPFRYFGEDTWLGWIMMKKSMRMVHENRCHVYTHAPDLWLALPQFGHGIRDNIRKVSRTQGYGASTLWKQRAYRWYVTNASMLVARCAQLSFFSTVSSYNSLTRRLIFLGETVIIILSESAHLAFLPTIHLLLPALGFSFVEIVGLLLFILFLGWLMYFFHSLIYLGLNNIEIKPQGINHPYFKVRLLAVYPFYCLFLDVAQCVACWIAALFFVPQNPPREGEFTTWEMRVSKLRETAHKCSKYGANYMAQVIYGKDKENQQRESPWQYLYVVGRALNAVTKHQKLLKPALESIGALRLPYRGAMAKSDTEITNLTTKPVDFFILGASKCGTSSLTQILMRHSRIAFQTRLGGEAAGKIKRCINEQVNTDHVDVLECHIFDKANSSPMFMQKLLKAYTPTLFDTNKAASSCLLGHYTPNYLFHPSAPFNIQEVYSERVLKRLKFIVMLREPAERCLSSYWYKCQSGNEIRSLSKAVDDGIKRSQVRHSKLDNLLKLESTEMPNHERRKQWEDLFDLSDPSSLFLEHVGKGMYADQLKLWFSIFRRDQFKFVTLDDLKEKPELTVAGVLKFLGVEEMEPAVLSSSKHVYNRRRTGDSPVPLSHHQSLGSSQKMPHSSISKDYSRGDYNGIVQRLRSFYSEHDKELRSMLGRELWHR